jgi:ribosomal protein S18 acetylase RimI-like enzyme
LASLQSISKKTFLETFSVHNSAEDMQLYLNNNLSIEKLESELSSKNTEFYFALLNKEITGYLKINFLDTEIDSEEKTSLEIERIYVLQAFQGMKIGQVLLNKVIQIAGQRPVDFIWLGVWEKNLKAINFYKKNGFTHYGEHIFMLGNDAQTDILMRRETKV